METGDDTLTGSSLIILLCMSRPVGKSAVQTNICRMAHNLQHTGLEQAFTHDVCTVYLYTQPQCTAFCIQVVNTIMHA